MFSGFRQHLKKAGFSPALKQSLDCWSQFHFDYHENVARFSNET